MSDNKDPIEDLPEDAPEDAPEDKTDDPLGIGIDSTTTSISVGVCVCFVLLCIIGLFFWLRSGSSGSSDEGTNSECTTPTHYTIEFKYADGVNPYNNFSIPPFVPKPPEFFGTTNN
jgi:hypothetical protein